MLLALPLQAATAQSAGISAGKSTDTAPDSYVIDSRGTTRYRDGVPLCHVNCGAAVSPFPRPPRPAGPYPIRPDVNTSTDRYPIRPEDRDRRAAVPVHAPVEVGVPRAPRPALPPTAATPSKAHANAVAQASGTEAAAPAKKSGGLTKEQKVLILNLGGAAVITAYGIGFWDYFQTAPKADGEGWFGRTTKHGGADKLGHFWATYALSHFFSHVYRWWDFDTEQANTYGALSSLGLQTMMEVGDAFSGEFGFSYEDALMNVAGAGAGYLLGKYPSLARKIDFRFEYIPTSFRDLTNDFLTNYDNQRYLVALKLDGFDMFHDSYLSYLELHAGYYTRGFQEYDPGDPDNRRRHLYFGVGFNVSKFVQNFVNTSVFDYVQVPYTSVGVSKGLD